MLIVPDVQDVYTPLETDVIVQLSEVSSWRLASFFTDIGYPCFFLLSLLTLFCWNSVSSTPRDFAGKYPNNV